MSAAETINYTQPNSYLVYYLQLLAKSRKKSRGKPEMPSLAVRWEDLSVDPDVLAAYRRACSISDSPHLPLLYPQVLSFGMQLAIFKHPSFPVSPLGVVHQRNQVVQRSPIPADQKFCLECAIGASRVVKQGLEFDINVVAAYGGNVAWEGVSTYLYRGKFGEPADVQPDEMPEFQPDETRDLLVPADAGRRYARISGDYNPIHLSSILARLFKFPRAIVHGMWSAAVCAAHVPQPEGPIRYDVAFKGPVFLGSRIRLEIGPATTGKRIELYCADNPRPCIKGWIRSATE